MTVEQLAHLLIKKIFSDHDVLEQIITNRDKLFMLTFYKKLRKLLKIQKDISIIFHSQMNDQTKRIN